MTETPLTTPKFQSGSTPGAQLRQAREAAGMALPAIGQALHLTVHYIKALENDEYNKLPALIFVKGYIRAYGSFLKLDVDALLASHDRYVQTLPPAKSHTLAGNYTRKRNDQALLWAGAATLVVLLGIVLGWWFFGRTAEPERTVQSYTTPVQPVAAQKDSASTDAAATDGTTSQAATGNEQTQPASTPAAATVAPETAAPVPPTATTTPSPSGGRQINLLRDGPDQLQISFASNSWIEIDDYANTKIYADMLHSGDNLLVKAKAPFQILLGDARNVKVNFNAMAVDISKSIRSDSTARLTLADNGGRNVTGVDR